MSGRGPFPMDSIFQSHYGFGHASAKLGTAGPNETLTQFLQAERPERKVVTAKIHPEKNLKKFLKCLQYSFLRFFSTFLEHSAVDRPERRISILNAVNDSFSRVFYKDSD